MDKTKQFLLCGSCVWCDLPLDSHFTSEKCPSCMNGKIESMPLSDNEIFKFCHDEIRGVTLEFTSNQARTDVHNVIQKTKDNSHPSETSNESLGAVRLYLSRY